MFTGSHLQFKLPFLSHEKHHPVSVFASIVLPSIKYYCNEISFSKLDYIKTLQLKKTFLLKDYHFPFSSPGSNPRQLPKQPAVCLIRDVPTL